MYLNMINLAIAVTSVKKKTFWSKFITSDLMRIHSCMRPFVCDNDGCGLAVTFSSGLYQHQALYHDTEKRHTCSYCGRRFSVTARLRLFTNLIPKLFIRNDFQYLFYFLFCSTRENVAMNVKSVAEDLRPARKYLSFCRDLPAVVSAETT